MTPHFWLHLIVAPIQHVRLGSPKAPITNVGISCDACDFFGVCTDASGSPVTSSSANRSQLVNLNAINTTGATVNVTASQVRYIMNGGTAQAMFGTPSGNSPRNIPQDDMTNIANLSVSKRFKASERVSFEFRANFLSVDRAFEDAGLFASGTGFGNRKVTGTTSGVIFGNASASRKLVFGRNGSVLAKPSLFGPPVFWRAFFCDRSSPPV